MSLWGWGKGSLQGHGQLRFNEKIEFVDVDGTLSYRLMNPDGGFYDAQQELYEEDVSLHLSDSDSDGAFMDALQDQLVQSQKDIVVSSGEGSMDDLWSNPTRWKLECWLSYLSGF